MRYGICRSILRRLMVDSQVIHAIECKNYYQDDGSDYILWRVDPHAVVLPIMSTSPMGINEVAHRKVWRIPL